ncbi:MAG: patatin-like phospholipase family protein, partial [Chloroflexi bacterium]|nr:patatin-like phospholipase family protein [Chloroflexota bacterium]
MKLGLAFGGGGARGAAHIGVLMELERLGLWPDIVTGASIGGFVAALVAAGLRPPDLVHAFQNLRAARIYALPGRRPALVSNRRLEALLVNKIGRPTFAGLSIPLAVTTVDLVARQEVVLEEGDVVSAVLATTAFPVVLPPVEREGRTLIDGGVLNNTPFDVARRLGADYVLAIDLSNSAPFGTPVVLPPGSTFLAYLLSLTQRQPLYQALSTVADILTAQNVQAHLALTPPELFLQPAIGTVGYFDFHRME